MYIHSTQNVYQNKLNKKTPNHIEPLTRLNHLHTYS